MMDVGSKTERLSPLLRLDNKPPYILLTTIFYADQRQRGLFSMSSRSNELFNIVILVLAVVYVSSLCNV